MAKDESKNTETTGLEKGLMWIGIIFVICIIVSFIGDPQGTTNVVIAGAVVIFAIGLYRAFDKKLIDSLVLFVLAISLAAAAIGINNNFSLKLAEQQTARVLAEQKANQAEERTQLMESKVNELLNQMNKLSGMQGFTDFLDRSRTETLGMILLWIFTPVLGVISSRTIKRGTRVSVLILAIASLSVGSYFYLVGGIKYLTVLENILTLYQGEVLANLVGRMLAITETIGPLGFILVKYRKK